MSINWVDAATLLVTFGAAWYTASAARAAKQSAKVSTDQFETQVKEQKRLERPRLVPLNHKVIQKPDRILRGWSNDESKKASFLAGKGGFSDYAIPIINAGNSFAIDVKYCFEFEDGIEAIKPAKFDGITISEPEYMEEYGENKFFKFTVTEGPASDRDSFYSPVANFFYGESVSYWRYISIIRSKEEEQIVLPAYFIVLSNIFLLKGIGKEEHESLRPNLLMTILYKDQYNEEHVDVYRMRLSDKHITSNGSALETWIDFEFIDPNENKPHQ